MRTRELTGKEMQTCITAAINALPPDAAGNKIILFVVAKLPEDNWINRCSNMPRKEAEEAISKWQINIDRRKTFGPDNNN